MSPLEAALLAAHEAGDQAALVALYTRAADSAKTDTAAAFFLTHAYIHALEAGDERAATLRARLVAMGRERPDDQPA